MKKLGKTLILVICIWLAFVLNRPSRPGARGHDIINVVRNESRLIQGRKLTKAELASEISKLRLDWDLNRFVPETTFESPTNWSVTLVPEKRNTYVNSQSLSLRILYLEFEQMKYPDITFSSNDKEETGLFSEALHDAQQ